jgi:hypothetical protein
VIGQLGRYLARLQALQRGDHLLAAGQVGAAGIGAELALAREPHHDDAGEDAQQDLRDDAGDPEAGPWPRSFLNTTRSTIMPMTATGKSRRY